jgi:hypothetical protein
MQRMLPLSLTLSAAFGLLSAGGVLAAPGGSMGGGMGGGGMGGQEGGTTMPAQPTEASRIPSHTSAPSALKEGMTIKDSAGVVVGKIAKVGQSGGAPAALVDVDGKTVVVMGSTLSVSGDSATSTQTKEQIAASPQPKPS